MFGSPVSKPRLISPNLLTIETIEITEVLPSMLNYFFAPSPVLAR